MMLIRLLVFLHTTIGGCADLLVLPPMRHDIDTHGTMRRIVTDGDAQIEVFVSRSDSNPQTFILRFSGGDAAGAAAFTAGRWGSRAVEVWCANYPGYGASSGPRSLARMASAALATFDALSREAAGRPIVVEGFSLGTVPALCVAARRPVAGVIVQNAPPLRQLILEGHGWWNGWILAGIVALEIPPDLDSIANAARCTAPAIFIVADHDRTVPPRFQQMIVDAYAGPTSVIFQRGADHVVPLSKLEQDQLESAFDRLLARNATSPAAAPRSR